MYEDAYAGTSRDPYLDSASGVLRNLLGIQDQAELDEAEASLGFLRESLMQEESITGAFDLGHLQRIHKKMFGDIYDWAGVLRTVEIQKGATPFARVAALEDAAGRLFRELAAEDYLRGLSAETFSARAGYFLGEINMLHPFREGNGRARREFIRQLAHVAGHEIDWSGADAT